MFFSPTTTVSPFEHVRRGDADYFQSAELDVLENSWDDNGNSLLSFAAMYGQLGCCRVIYRRCPQLLYQRTHNGGFTPLHHAARSGHNEVVKFLLTVRATMEQEEKGINNGGGVVETILIDEELLMMVSDGKYTALHLAAFGGHLESVKSLLEADRSKKLLGMVNIYKSTALHYAVEYQHLEIVEVLVEADPDFEYSADTDGKTPLFMAWKEALSGDQKQVRIRDFLIQRQPSQCAVRTGLNGWTILHHAACEGDLSAIVEIIRTNPSCSELVGNQGQNFLHLATRLGHENIVKYVLGLVNISDNILNGQDMNDDTPLHVATRKGSAIIVLSLLSDHRVNKFIKNKRGNIAFAEASSIVLEKLIEDKYPIKYAMQGDLEFFREIQEFVLRKCTDEYGESVLSTAVKEGHLNCCELISERCPELLLKTNKKGFSALHTAASNGKDDIVKFLLGARGKIVDYELLILASRDNQCTALHFAAEGGHFESAKLLIEADPSNKLLEMKNLYQDTALHMAVKEHHLEIVQLLVDAHPDFEYSCDNLGNTPLLIALQEASSADQRTVEIRKLLIEKQSTQCRIPTGSNKWTLLHHATYIGDLSAVKEIMHFAPDCCDLFDKAGQNFLHVAAKFNQDNVVKYALELTTLGENILNKKDVYDNTPLHISISCGNQGISSHLLDDSRVNKMLENLDGKKALDVGPSVPLHCAMEGDVDFLLSIQVDVLWKSTDEYGNSLLYIAASKGHLNCCEVISKRCPELLCKTNNSGVSPLHIASSNGEEEIVKLLIEADPTNKLLRLTDIHKETAMHYAVEKHHFGIVKLLVDADSDYEYFANDSGDTPVSIAVREASSGDRIAAEIRKLLIEKHANICKMRTGSNEWTILHQATYDGDLSAIKDIIHFVPECCDVVDKEGLNFLHIAAKFDQVNVVKYILEETNIADNVLNERDKYGNTPLHVAISCENQGIAFALRNDPRVDKMAKNIEGTETKDVGPSVLFQYAIKGDVDFFRAIQVDVLRKCSDEDGNSLLSVAVRNDYLNCCEVISKRCPELLYKTNRNGVSTLHTSAFSGNAEIAKCLLNARGKAKQQGVQNLGNGGEEGKNDSELLMMVSIDQRTALHYSVDNGHLMLAKLLIEADPTNKLLGMSDSNKETALHYAVKNHHLEMVKLLVEADSNFVYSANDSGETPLFMALKEATSHDPITEDIRVFLIQKQKSQCKIPTGRKRWTLLQNAASIADLSAIEEIIQFCPESLAFVDKEGKNFLHIAVSSKHEHVVNYILGLPDISDSVLNGKDNHGETPLHTATKMRSVNIAISLLYDKRVRKTIQNNSGKNALDAITFDYDKRRAGVLGLVGEGDEKELKDQSDFDLLVGALIATVSFTAGITVPGGFNSDGQNKGTAILHKKVTFAVFVAFNTIALVLSLFAVFTQFCMKRLVDDKEISLQRKVATICSIGAIFAMVVAFIMGSIAVLSTSLLLVLIVCGICSIFFVCAFYSLWRMRRQQRQSRAQ